jgi:formylmethanofuran--tetrahydromethanopterin N-formyltransferase
MPAEIEDTYAEAFRSLYVVFLITARDRTWLQHAVNAVTGHGSSSIFCDCEAGVTHDAGPGSRSGLPTPDDRPGAVCQLHVPRFWKNREQALESALLKRVSQNVLTCPTTRCFSVDSAAPSFRLGRKLAFFGDGYERLEERFGRRMWIVPTMGGEFCVDRHFAWRDGIMGGNLWFMATIEAAALEAAERAVAACDISPGVITPFPGGVAGSGSKAGSRYSFLFASTNAEFCPTLRERPDVLSRLPEGVNSVMEIIINGRDLESVSNATQAAITAAVDVPGLQRITAGNYGGRLGKSWVWLKGRPAAANDFA